MKLTKEQLLAKLQENPELKFVDLPEDSCDESLFDEVKAEFDQTDSIVESYEFDNKTTPEIKKTEDRTIIHKQFSVEIKVANDGKLQAIVNSGQLDRHGEVLDMKGLDIKTYMTNPVLAYSHDYQKMSVGRTDKLTKTREGKLVADFVFATDVEGYDLPKILDQLYRKKYQFAFSIGFIPQEMQGNTYTKSTMIEFSPVLIGADAQALLKAKSKSLTNPTLRGGENMKLTKEQIKSMLKGNPETTFESMKEMADEDVYDAAKAELEAETKAALDAEKAKTQTDEVVKKIDELTKQLTTLTETVKAIDVPVKKNINTSSQTVKSFEAKPEKEKNALKFLYYVKGLQTNNFSELENVVGKDAMNTTDTGVVLPPAEFTAEVERLEEKVGVARNFATLKRSTNGLGFTYLLGDDDLEIFDTDEGGVKKSTKLTYAQKSLAWRKFAGILPITDELNEDSAVDLWNDATQRFARAYTKKEDYLVFLNQANTGKQKKGVLYETGTNKVILANGYDSISFDDLVDMIYGVPTPSAEGGRFYLHREIVGVIMKIKDENGRPIWQNAAQAGLTDGTPGTILGKPYSVVESFPGVSAEDEDLPFMTFGNLRYTTLGERTDLALKIFDSGSVGDPDDEDQSDQINLLTQDAQALRAVKRMNAVVRFPAAFSVAVTGSSLS
jgi:HK97 family phage major capsid protein